NSSIDKNLAGGHAQNGGPNGYGPNGYGSPTIQEDQVAGPYNGGPVRSPTGPPQGRKPIPLGNSGDPPIMPPPGGKLPSTARGEQDKKKGWLKRRFSKKE
ncbi:hypothetical protein LTR53_017957, partial [Teratosphaeriaceae sp. CCFEE 6253]